MTIEERAATVKAMMAIAAYQEWITGHSLAWADNMMKRFLERFIEKIGEPFDIHNNCWEWTGAKTGSGYGQIWLNGKKVSAHRVSYELFIGPIPEEHDVDHLCRNHCCMRPDHLQALSYHDNRQWKLSKTHCPQGHPYVGDNLRIGSSGERRCRVCHNAQERERHHKRRAG